MEEQERRNDFGDDGEEVLDDSVLQNGGLLDDVGNRLGLCILHVRVLTVVNLLYVTRKSRDNLEKKETLPSRQDLLIRVLNHVLHSRANTKRTDAT